MTETTTVRRSMSLADSLIVLALAILIGVLGWIGGQLIEIRTSQAEMRSTLSSLHSEVSEMRGDLKALRSEVGEIKVLVTPRRTP